MMTPILAMSLLALSLNILEHSGRPASEQGSSNESKPHTVLPVEFKNGQLGIILRDSTEGNPPSKEVPMDLNFQVPNSPIGGSEQRTISANVSMLEIGDQARVKLTKGARVTYVSVSGHAELEIERSADVSHVDLHDHATVTILPGAQVSSVVGTDHSTVHFFGGSPRIMLAGHSTVHIREKPDSYAHSVLPDGGSNSEGSISYGANVQIHIYASEADFRSGSIIGAWDYRTTFSIRLLESDEHFTGAESPKVLPPQLVVHTWRDASFDCVKAISQTEKIICDDPVLVKLDRRLHVRYKRALAFSSNAQDVKASQRRWLRTVRSECTTAECIRMAYERRIAALEELAIQSQ